MDPIISVARLTKRYKKSTVPAVDDISFDVHPGELLAFLASRSWLPRRFTRCGLTSG